MANEPLVGRAVSELPAATTISWSNAENAMDDDLFAISRSVSGTNTSLKLTGLKLRNFIAPIKTFYGASQLGITSGSATINDAVNAMPTGSMAVLLASNFVSSDMPENSNSAGTVYIYKVTNNVHSFAICNRGSGTYIRTPTTDGLVGDWRKIASYEALQDATLTMKADVSGWGFGTGGNKIYRKDNVVYLNLILTCEGTVGTSAVNVIDFADLGNIGDAFKPPFTVRARGSNAAAGTDINLSINKNGVITVQRTPSGTEGNARFFLTYPAAN